MELTATINKTDIFDSTNCIYLNNQMLNDEKIDVVISKNKITNFSSILEANDGSSVKVVGFTKDGDKGKKFIATAIRIGDVMYTKIPEPVVFDDNNYKDTLKALHAEGCAIYNSFNEKRPENFRNTLQQMFLVMKKMSEV